jgi:hypothetical protein
MGDPVEKFNLIRKQCDTGTEKNRIFARVKVRYFLHVKITVYNTTCFTVPILCAVKIYFVFPRNHEIFLYVHIMILW